MDRASEREESFLRCATTNTGASSATSSRPPARKAAWLTAGAHLRAYLADRAIKVALFMALARAH